MGPYGAGFHVKAVLPKSNTLSARGAHASSLLLGDKKIIERATGKHSSPKTGLKLSIVCSPQVMDRCGQQIQEVLAGGSRTADDSS